MMSWGGGVLWHWGQSKLANVASTAVIDIALIVASVFGYWTLTRVNVTPVH